MQTLAASAFAIALLGGVLDAQAEDRFRHFESGVFTLNLGEAADLTSDHIALAFVAVWPHPFGNRAINLSVGGKSYSLGVGARLDLMSRYARANLDQSESTLTAKHHCYLEIADFENPKEGNPKVTFALDCM